MHNINTTHIIYILYTHTYIYIYHELLVPDPAVVVVVRNAEHLLDLLLWHLRTQPIQYLYINTEGGAESSIQKNGPVRE